MCLDAFKKHTVCYGCASLGLAIAVAHVMEPPGVVIAGFQPELSKPSDAPMLQCRCCQLCLTVAIKPWCALSPPAVRKAQLSA